MTFRDRHENVPVQEIIPDRLGGTTHEGGSVQHKRMRTVIPPLVAILAFIASMFASVEIASANANNTWNGGCNMQSGNWWSGGSYPWSGDTYDNNDNCILVGQNWPGFTTLWDSTYVQTSRCGTGCGGPPSYDEHHSFYSGSYQYRYVKLTCC